MLGPNEIRKCVNKNDLTCAISIHKKVVIKIEKCKITEWVGLLGMLGHWNQDSLPIAEKYEGIK